VNVPRKDPWRRDGWRCRVLLVLWGIDHIISIHLHYLFLDARASIRARARRAIDRARLRAFSRRRNDAS
jgi:hypothetical protein